MKWFNTFNLFSFDVGRVHIGLELDRRSTYLGVQWTQTRSRLHIFLGLLAMTRIHVILPPKKRRRKDDGDDGVQPSTYSFGNEPQYPHLNGNAPPPELS